MKFVHLSDLHLGKRVNEYPMLEDQKYILNKILNIIDDEKPDAVLIAGDIYDKSVPTAEAVKVFDDFLVRLADKNLQVFIESGNHDSVERIAFGGRLMENKGVHITPPYSGEVNPIVLTDEYGECCVYMLPFIRPLDVRRELCDDTIESYTDALNAAVKHMGIDTSVRNVLVTHQFITDSQICDSEEISIGGSDNVDSWVFDDFDYVALGHIHGPQNVTKKIRYCGSPLKYSFSEANHQKSVTVMELFEKDNLKIRTVPLIPKHDMVEIKGEYDQLMNRDFYMGTGYCDDYMHITLTDEYDIPDAVAHLRTIYKNLMKMDYDNSRTRLGNTEVAHETVDINNADMALKLFEGFFKEYNGRDMDDNQSEYIKSVITEIWEEEN